MLLVFVIGHAAVYSHPASTGTPVVPVAAVTVDGADGFSTQTVNGVSTQVTADGADGVSTQTVVPVSQSQSHPASTGTPVVLVAEVTVDGADGVSTQTINGVSTQVTADGADGVSTQTAMPVSQSQSHPALTGTPVLVAEVTVDGADGVSTQTVNGVSTQVTADGADGVSTQTAMPVSQSQTVTLNSDIDLQVVVTNTATVSAITGRDCCGICEHDSCDNEVFIACPTCLRFLCHYHMDSNCQMHSRLELFFTHSANHDAAKFVVFVDGETGVEFLVPFEDNFDYTNTVGINGDNPVEFDRDFDSRGAVHPTKRVRRKTSHPDMWGRNVARTSHLKGHSYKQARGIAGSKTVPAKMVQPCNCTKCRYKCTEKFPDNVRTKIFTEFYELADYSRQKDYVVNHVVEIPSKTMSKTANKHREVARAFYLSYEGNRQRVCGNFFSKTLDLKLRSIQKYLTVHHGSMGVGSVPDGRGRHAPPNKTPEWKRDMIRKHIQSFPTVESH